MDPNEAASSESRKGSGLPMPILLLGASVAIYVLSIGPASRFALAHPRTGPTIETFYQPIIYLAKYCPPFRTTVVFYIREIWYAAA